MSENITCVAAPAGREWERPRILLSGHNDGTIRVWARELVPCRSPNSSSGYNIKVLSELSEKIILGVSQARVR